MNWGNKGVTFLYEPCSIALALLDASNNEIARSWLSGINPQKNWAPGPVMVASSINFSGVPTGNYQLAVGLFTSTNQARPDFMIGNQGRTSNGWYAITNLPVLNIAPPATNATNLTAVLSNGILIISWPTDHMGWTLQSQISSSNMGLSTNWINVASSVYTNQIYISISQTNQAAFYRLKY
jgi:hypothetical protein